MSFPFGFGMAATTSTCTLSGQRTGANSFGVSGVGFVQSHTPSSRRANDVSSGAASYRTISIAPDPPPRSGEKRCTASRSLFSEIFVSDRGKTSLSPGGIWMWSKRYGSLPRSSSSIDHPQRGFISSVGFASSIHSSSASSPTGFGRNSEMTTPVNAVGMHTNDSPSAFGSFLPATSTCKTRTSVLPQ